MLLPDRLHRTWTLPAGDGGYFPPMGTKTKRPCRAIALSSKRNGCQSPLEFAFFDLTSHTIAARWLSPYSDNSHGIGRA